MASNLMVKIVGGAGILLFSAAAVFGTASLAKKFINSSASQNIITIAGDKNEIKGKTLEERVKDAHERAEQAKGVYMTAAVANDKGRPATRLRDSLLSLIDATELNAVVIDVKETDGIFLPESLKDLISEFHQKNTWAIARLVAFNDTVAAKTHPEIALKRSNGSLWLDNRRNAWLDPASQDAREYLAGVAKKAIDYGFDEIQFDYIRFPSDGDVKNIIYPVFKPKEQQKYEALGGFFQYINHELKAYKPEIILSADLFGYVAIQKSDLGVGQRMEDLGNSFDFISFMVYPSHYYNGFYMDSDTDRGLAALAYPYRSKNIAIVASNQPYDIVYRSLLVAKDFLAGKDVFNKATTTKNNTNATTTAAETPKEIRPVSNAKLRPWLQDFNLGADTNRGIYYDALKVRAQIKASEDAGSSGWLLWNASNVYTEAALKK
ncbi:MAG: putative glycoside hydrolase [bacterium]|nr:putative glycoside hydrolase [bacterium]